MSELIAGCWAVPQGLATCYRVSETLAEASGDSPGTDSITGSAAARHRRTWWLPLRRPWRLPATMGPGQAGMSTEVRRCRPTLHAPGAPLCDQGVAGFPASRCMPAVLQHCSWVAQLGAVARHGHCFVHPWASAWPAEWELLKRRHQACCIRAERCGDGTCWRRMANFSIARILPMTRRSVLTTGALLCM